jgi:hypothetical protein
LFYLHFERPVHALAMDESTMVSSIMVGWLCSVLR